MAEMLSKPVARGRYALSTRVDLTPMVDLGFLLITFFVFTGRMGEPSVMTLHMPAEGPPTLISELNTLNLVLGADDKVIFYPGNDVGNLSCTDFSPAGVRKLIMEQQQAVRERTGDARALVVLVYPSDAASYKNLVDLLDELVILGVTRYTVMDQLQPGLLSGATGPNPC